MKNVNKINENIYITNDEEIKEGDWFIREGSIHKCFKVHKTDIEFLTSIDSVYCGSNTFWSKEYCKKIILTTDQDLIKDGVQAIDDVFLEWFIRNPSCETVNTEKVGGKYFSNGTIGVINYEIIIPKEEPKTAWVGVMNETINNYTSCRYELKDIYQGENCLPNFKTKEECQYWCDNDSPFAIAKEEPKQEPKQKTTLEDYENGNCIEFGIYLITNFISKSDMTGNKFYENNRWECKITGDLLTTEAVFETFKKK
jgi:hypothetical protein